MDIAGWLAALGLDKYAAVFLENEITPQTLPYLSETDLEKLGLPMGPRKRVLAAVAGNAEPAAKPGTEGIDPGPGQQQQAERRQLTVMFVDMVGSTALSTRLDPEEMGQVIRSYQNAVAGEVTRLDGHVAKYMGDGVLAYFGWPHAHENDAERAVRAGLATVRAIAGLQAPGGLAIEARIGIATGLVVVGDLIGKGAAREETVVGDTPNLAARLQAMARPGQVVAAEATRRLVGGLFEFEALAERQLKGISEPVTAFAVVREHALESRFAARGAGPLSAIVGREQELALLWEHWERASAGEGQVVLISGEAGIGKSRITEALIERLAERKLSRIIYQCSPYHSDSPLYPTIQQLSLVAGFAAEDDAPARLDKLDAWLRQQSVPASHFPLYAQLMGLDGESRYGATGLTPQQIRNRTLRALVDQLARAAEKRPIMVLIEDAHWIDSTTLELLELSLDVVERSRILIVVTARPTFEHKFGGHPIVSRLMLNRLGRAQVAAIALRVSGGKPLPEDLLAEIMGKADGVPLFIEEIVKAILESGALREVGGAYVLVDPLGDLKIPTTLHDSLMARLDRLDRVKEVAQIASVIGRAFDYRTLVTIAPQTEAELVAGLDRLVEAELVFRRGTPPDEEYLFKHALVRDTAYESLLKSRRRAVHAALLAVLESDGNVEAEILAHHAEHGGQTGKAIGYWERAGRNSVARPAFKEAIGHFERALRLLRGCQRDRDNQEHELRLLLDLAGARIALLGFASPETVATFELALHLAEEIGETLADPSLHLRAIYGSLGCDYVRSIENPVGCERFLALAETVGDAGGRLAALRLLTITRLHAGRYLEALALADEALSFYDPVYHRDLAYLYSHDARVASLVYRGWALIFLGFPDRATSALEAALSWTAECRHVNTTGYALGFSALVFNALMRRVPEMSEMAARAVPLCEDHAMFGWAGYARAFLGWALVRQGRHEDGLAEMKSGISEIGRSAGRRWLALLHGLHAESLMLAGEAGQSAAALAIAYDVQRECGDMACAPVLHCLAGNLHLAGPRPDANAARAAFGTALELAQTQGSKTIELRAKTGLARICRDEGRIGDARALLLPIYGWFTEGFGTPDLIEAKAVLDELG